MRFIKLDKNGKVISVRIGTKKLNNEIQSDVGDLGQIMKEDGTFIDAPIEPIKPQTTIEEQILAENQYQTALLETQMLGGM